MFKYLIQPEVQDLLADFVFVVRRIYPKITLSFFDNPQLAKRAHRLHDYLVENEIRTLASRYFTFVLNSVGYSDWRLIFRKAATKEMVNLFLRSIR